MPPLFTRLSNEGPAPAAAVIVVGLVVGVLTSIGNVKMAQAFSAFAVLIYYALTNLPALRLPSVQFLYPRQIAIVGLAPCLFPSVLVPLPGQPALVSSFLGPIWKQLAPGLWAGSPGEGGSD